MILGGEEETSTDRTRDLGLTEIDLETDIRGLDQTRTDLGVDSDLGQKDHRKILCEIKICWKSLRN